MEWPLKENFYVWALGIVAALLVAACGVPQIASPMATPGPVLFPEAQPDANWTRVEARGWPDQAGFSVMLPPGWRLDELQGVDSYVGEITGEGVRLLFDYGWYSWPLNPEDEPEHEYLVAYEEIGGREAKLLAPASSSPVNAPSFEAATGVYFGGLENGYALNVIGRGLTPEQQETAVAIFRSIRMLE